MRNIPGTETQSFYRTLPWSVFHQIGRLLKQINQPGSIVFTESVFSSFNMGPAEPFVLVISQKFCALLQGKMIHSEGAIADQNSLNDSVDLCQMGLTFEPETIAAFLTQLETLLPSPILQTRSIQALIQPNDPAAQSAFTLQLIDLLASPASHSPSSTETALRQQVEQERLINEVTTLIRQSLELPVILETAVQQVRQFLKADRLIIYQFDIPALLVCWRLSQIRQRFGQRLLIWMALPKYLCRINCILLGLE